MESETKFDSHEIRIISCMNIWSHLGNEESMRLTTEATGAEKEYVSEVLFKAFKAGRSIPTAEISIWYQRDVFVAEQFKTWLIPFADMYVGAFSYNRDFRFVFPRIFLETLSSIKTWNNLKERGKAGVVLEDGLPEYFERFSNRTEMYI